MIENISVPDPLPGAAGANGAGEAGAAASVNGGGPAAAQSTASPNDGIAGMSVMRGLMLYGAVLAFAGVYVDFMVEISTAHAGAKPAFDATLIAAAAALSGVLGSAFALKIGVAHTPTQLNTRLADHLTPGEGRHRPPLRAWIRRALSLEPSDADAKSWPLTIGIWVYAAIASSVAIVYILNQNETPPAVKALAVTFGGYVIALIHTAYNMASS